MQAAAFLRNFFIRLQSPFGSVAALPTPATLPRASARPMPGTELQAEIGDLRPRLQNFPFRGLSVAGDMGERGVARHSQSW